MKKLLLSAAVSATLAFAGAAMAALPNVSILATGGTIAGSAASNTQMTGYKAGSIGIQTLINAVPAMKQYANISGEQICNIDSANMTSDIQLKLAKRVNELLARSDVNGIVITHGTDTLEETAYFLNLTVKSDKPVVLVGAMRPATAISADGPLNLLNAVKVATSKEAAGKGVLVILNDEINGARDVTKMNTTNVDTFHAPILGALGMMNSDKPAFFRASTKRHTKASEFDISKVKKLPRVDIIYSHADDDGVMAKAAVAAGAKGIVHAGTGDGSIHEKTFPALEQASKKGVVVVRSSRVPSGITTVGTDEWTKAVILESGSLNPQKARILLQLALSKTTNREEIRRIFEQY
jgi:L-asparaginase